MKSLPTCKREFYGLESPAGKHLRIRLSIFSFESSTLSLNNGCYFSFHAFFSWLNAMCVNHPSIGQRLISIPVFIASMSSNWTSNFFALSQL